MSDPLLYSCQGRVDMLPRSAKPTKAVMAFLKKHLREWLAKNGYLTKYAGKGNWPFVDRVANAGLVEIVDPDKRFPYNWAGTRITAAGRAVLLQEGK